MQYKVLTEEELIRIANVYLNDNWEQVNPNNTWNGHDLVGDTCIFQISFNGTIRVFDKETVVQKIIDWQLEDLVRIELIKVMSAYE